MASTVGGGLSRVTIVAPNAQVDLALPANVTLANLLPTLLRYTGDGPAGDGGVQGGWTLSRLGGQLLDASCTPAQLDVRDGEMLYLTPAGQAAPEMVFDDVIDAVATATQNRPDRWTLAATRRFAGVFAAGALLAGALVVLLAGPPQLPGALIGLGEGAALIVVATIMSRMGRSPRGSVLLAAVAMCYAGVAGLLLLGGDRPLHQLAAPHVLVAATAIVVYGSVSALAVGAGRPVFVGGTVAGAFLGLGAGICLAFGASAAAAAAIIGAVVFSLIPALSMLSYRMARLPVPSIPTGPADLKADTETVDGKLVLSRSALANSYLTGFIATVAAIEVAAEIVAGLGGGLAGSLFCAVLALLLLLRARPLSGQAQRLPLLAAGTVGLGVVAAGGFAVASPTLRLTAILGGLILAALAALVYGFAVAGRRISPIWGRLLDIGDVALILAIIPLTLWVCGLFAWIRAIKS